jgi:hypothetical protein
MGLRPNPTNLHPSLVRIEARQAEWKAKHKAAVVALQLSCPHLALAECTYHGFHHGGSMPPIRICLACGLTEEGWGCGNIVLSSESRRDLKTRKGQSIGSLSASRPSLAMRCTLDDAALLYPASTKDLCSVVKSSSQTSSATLTSR